VVGSKYEFKEGKVYVVLECFTASDPAGMLDYQVLPPYETMATARAYSTDG